MPAARVSFQTLHLPCAPPKEHLPATQPQAAAAGALQSWHRPQLWQTCTRCLTASPWWKGFQCPPALKSLVLFCSLTNSRGAEKRVQACSYRLKPPDVRTAPSMMYVSIHRSLNHLLGTLVGAERGRGWGAAWWHWGQHRIRESCCCRARRHEPWRRSGRWGQCCLPRTAPPTTFADTCISAADVVSPNTHLTLKLEGSRKESSMTPDRET